MSEIESPGIDGDELLSPAPDGDADDRHVLTFYSFKGGVGRTMALANVAFRLANRHALRVIVVDWDLEAPGLHRFFGYRDTELGDKPGVVDFFLEWQERYERGAESPPDIRPWLVPVRAPVPAYGSVSILTAGKLDKGYGGRLESLDWRAFYEASAGALAVETLRKQLIEAADVVLVDSRTGLTDAGGICTVQLPDGVVLMTAPNEQSLAGTERVARTIAGSKAKRAGRGKPRIWLSVSRIPMLEETDASHAWLEEHRSWFEQGIESELWRREEHLHGLRSHAFPHRPRFALGENILNDPSGTAPEDPLARAYDDFATLVLEWSQRRHKEARIDKGVPGGRIEDLQARVDAASARGDAPSLAIALAELGSALYGERRYHEAIAHLERARGIQLAAGTVDSVETTRLIAAAWRDQGWPNNALKLCEEAHVLGERLGSNSPEMTTFMRGSIHYYQCHYREAWTDFSLALELARIQKNTSVQPYIWTWMGHVRLRQRRLEEAWSLYERSLTVFRNSATHDIAWLLRAMGVVRREQGRLAEAETLFSEALKCEPDAEERVRIHWSMGLLKVRNRRPDEAIALLEQAIALLGGLGSLISRLRCLTDLAKLQTARGFASAVSLLDEATHHLDTSGWQEESGNARFCRAEILRARAYVHRIHSHPADAVRCARQALEIFRGLREERYEEALTLAELSQDHAAHQQPAEAAAARQEGLAILRELNETFDETELFGSPLPA